jgi:CelD/BcsL family acetyltransferase involved in cellulose biosynthesis
VDPDARDLSPGVLMVHGLIERALAAGISRIDFMRGNESYKYEWGAVDEPIQRLLVRRRDDLA